MIKIFCGQQLRGDRQLHNTSSNKYELALEGKQNQKKWAANQRPPGVGASLTDWQHPMPAAGLAFVVSDCDTTNASGCAKTKQVVEADSWVCGNHHRPINQKLVKGRPEKNTTKESPAKPTVIPGGRRDCACSRPHALRSYTRGFILLGKQNSMNQR